MFLEKLRKKRKPRKGLTLIEISVVVMILGALIAIVALNINPGELKDETAVLKLKKDARELQTYLEKYAQKYGNYPSEEQGLKALYEKPTIGDNIPDDYVPIVKNKSVTEDPWKKPYILRYDEYGDIAIYTMGKDGKEGGEGKNADFNILAEDEYPAAFR